mgnify:CR=1 FL=1
MRLWKIITVMIIETEFVPRCKWDVIDYRHSCDYETEFVPRLNNDIMNDCRGYNYWD